MVKRTCCLFFLLTCVGALGDNLTSNRLVDVGTTKAAVFDETVSPDGAYAIGWTILAQNPKAKPVDWSKWSADDPDGFIEQYDTDGPDSPSNGFYKLADCVLDLKNKTCQELPSDEPDFPHKNRGFLFAAWSPPAHGIRYALVENNARFSTANMWLIKMDDAGMHVSEIVHKLDRAVEPIIAAKRPLVAKEYETFYSLSGTELPPIQIPIKAETAEIPFASDIPKSEVDSSEVDGTVTLDLGKGAVTKASSDTKADNPLVDDPALAKADQELNAVYAKLVETLGPTDRAALKTEQLAWINERDSTAQNAMDSTSNAFAARNKALLDETQKRLVELQARVK